MRVERIVLEHHGAAAIGGIDVIDDLVVDADFARGDRFQSRDHAQEGRLATARGPDDDDELAVVDLDVDTVKDLLAIIGFLDV